MSLNKKLLELANHTLDSQQRIRDRRNPLEKGLDIARNKSYADEDAKAIAKRLRLWEKNEWSPKMTAYIDAEIKRVAPALKPGTAKYKQTFDAYYNKNYRELLKAKDDVQRQVGTRRTKGQTQRQLDNDYTEKESVRTGNTKKVAAAKAVRDTGEAVLGSLGSGSTRSLRFVAQTVADIGKNDDGGIADRATKSLKQHEQKLDKTYPAYSDIKNNGSFIQKVAVSGVEQLPGLAVGGGAAGLAGKGVFAVTNSAKAAKAAVYSVNAGNIWSQAYGDGNDTVRQEIESATPQQLANAERSAGIYEAMFNENIKAGMTDDEAFTKARDQTISQIAEEGGTTVGLATMAISMVAPGIGSQAAKQIGVSGAGRTALGQKAANWLATKADSGKVARYAIPTLNVAQRVGRGAVEEGLQEGFTDRVGQKAAVDVGVRDDYDNAQTIESALMGAVLGGSMGGGTVIATKDSRYDQAKARLSQAQDNYADVAAKAQRAESLLRTAKPESPAQQKLTSEYQEATQSLAAMESEAKAMGIPLTSLARKAPRLTPIDSPDSNDTGGAPVQQPDSAATGASDTSTSQTPTDLGVPPSPTVTAEQDEPASNIASLAESMSEQELDAQDANIADLIAEQKALDEAIVDGSGSRSVEESVAKAQAWYEQKRGVNKEGLGGIVARAQSVQQDAQLEQQQQEQASSRVDINDYVASQRAKQAEANAQVETAIANAKTPEQKAAAQAMAEERAKQAQLEEVALAQRVALAQPSEGETFDTTITGADGVPFNLAQFWDSSKAGKYKPEAIAGAFNGEVDQNLSKAKWSELPEGVQKQLHSWMSEQLDRVRLTREQSPTEQAVNTQAPKTAPAKSNAVFDDVIQQPDDGADASIADIDGGADMGVNNDTPSSSQSSFASDSSINDINLNPNPQPIQVNRLPAAPSSKTPSVPAPTELTADNPVINIPTPNAATQSKAVVPTDAEVKAKVYKSKPLANAAIKKQKINPKTVEVVATDGGWTIKDSETIKVDGTPAINAATDKDGNAKWFGSNDKAQAFIQKKGLLDTHEVVSAGKSRFEIQPKADSTPQADVEKSETKSTAEKSQNDVSDQNSKSRFADNKLFTEDKVAAARARLKSKLTQLNSGFDPEILMDGMTLAGAYIESGVRKFADYAKMMIEDTGVEVKPYLLSFWEGARNYPGLDTEGMTSVEESKREFDTLNAEIDKTSQSLQPKEPETYGTGAQKKTLIGKNNEGLPLWESENGIRAIEEYGMFVNEGVSITPTGGEREIRKDKFKTTDELSENNNDAATTSNQDDRQRAETAGTRSVSTADAERANAGRVQAEPTSNMDSVDGRSDRQDTDARSQDSRSTEPDQRAAATNRDSGTRSTGSNNGSNQQSVSPTNYTVSPDFNPLRGGWQKVAERNVAIIELIKTIDQEGRSATPAEQQLLAEYAGWGASDIKIFPHPDKGYESKSWQALGEKLESLLTPDEYATARRTTQYAHYTPAPVVSAMYQAFDQFGFKGGQVLEPASGIGIFNGLMPKDMADSSSYVGLELDSITGRIAQLLYPNSDMKMGDYTKAKLPDNHFDAAIGNPPFADISVSYGKGKSKQSFQLHDYFFAKTMDKLKPGGIMAFVTSKGTMDKNGSKAREWLASQADIVGAIRQPSGAFKDAGTSVVTDIIFLRKRMEGESPSDTAWINTKEIAIGDKTAYINEYFVNNPDMVLGSHAITSGQFGDTYTVTPNAGAYVDELNKAIASLPKDIYMPARGSKAEAVKVVQSDYGVNSSQQKEGGVYLKDGQLMKVEDGVGKPLTHRYGNDGQSIALTDKQKKFLNDYVGVRDALKQSQRDQLNDSPNWQRSLDSLSKTYDQFVKKHGHFMAHTIVERENDDGTMTTYPIFKNKAVLFLDVESVLVSALETIVDGKSDGKNGVIKKGSYFNGRTLNKPKAPTIHTIQDAMVYVLDNTGKPDIKKIAEVAGKTEQQVMTELGDQVYLDPATGQAEMAENYLSGNVLDKLNEAESKAKSDKSYARNVEALKQVQPKPIAPNDIASNLGAAWIPNETINRFATEVLDANITVKYSQAAGLWDVKGYSRNSDYQTPDKTAVELMEAILNSRKIAVSYTVDGKSYTDEKKTELANQVAKKIQTAFKNWIWKDDTRAHELADYYNKTYNNIVPPTFNGDHLTLAGMSSMIKLRPHQKRGIYRVISQGDTYLNHAVGAGKTFTMIAAAMEEKRLGLINKPMFVVPNHMLAQFSQEFLMLYPAANILVADEQNFHTHNRKAFMAQASVNNPDAIIITHSSFKKIGVNPETEKRFLTKTLDDWREALSSAKEFGSAGMSVRQLERNVQSMETKLEDLLKREEKDTAVYFEDMGVDKLIVDEMHEFRKLSYATKMGSVKGIVPTGSQMASDLQMKIEIIREKNPTRSIVGASGTPVTNTMGELYSVQQYFQPKQLRTDGLHHFDSWASQFGEVVEGLEQNAAGNYELVKRFAKFVNVPELMSRVRWFMDVLTSDQLGDVVNRPDVVGGGREVAVIPAPDGFDEFQKSLADRISAIRKRGGKAEKGADIILKVITDGRFGAIDPRFVDPDLPSDPNSKLNRVIADIAEAYHATADNKYTSDSKIDELSGGALMMFTDIGLGEQSADTRGFDMKAWINSELIRLGVAPEHIAFMRDNKSHAKKGKLFEDMRQGRKRILIGGKDMETGVNVQKRLTHLFHLDAPWFPASVEQREGRIIRQGNQNKEVVIRGYATKGSYDSTMWGMVARKARFIAQAMNGDISVRHMDDISEASAFEQASALSSGDPRALQLAGLRQDVEALDRYYSAYQNAKFENQTGVKQAQRSIERAKRELADIDSKLASHKNIETGSVIGEVNGKSFDNRDEFGQAILAKFDKLASDYTVGEQTLATAAGYDINYNGVMLSGGIFVADVDIDIPKSNDAVLFDNTMKEVSATGLATSIINRVNGLEKYRAQIEKQVGTYETDAKNYQRRADQPFDSLDELNQKKRELADLEEVLGEEAKAIKAQETMGNAQQSEPLTDADRLLSRDSRADTPKAPNGKPSNLTSKQWAQVRTPAFKKWFGDWENDPENASKIVDKNGEPLIVYHGSPEKGITEFRGSPQAGGLLFFTENKGDAIGYSNGENSGYLGMGSAEDKVNLSVAREYLVEQGYSDMFNGVLLSTDISDKSKVYEYAFESNVGTVESIGAKLRSGEIELSDAIDQINSFTNSLYKDGQVYGVFLNVTKPYNNKSNPLSWREAEKIGASKLSEKSDGVFVTEETDGAIAVFNPSQIKSATDNIGTFDSNSNDIRYSKSNPAKGATGTTRKQVIETLQKRFGKDTVAKLIKAGMLRVRSLNDFVNKDGRLLVPKDAEGIFHEGKVTLIADNLTDDTIVATFLHEMGGHAGIQSMMNPTAYANLMTAFDKLVQSGNKYAVAAKDRAEQSTYTQDEARDEYLPYLISEHTTATERKGALGTIKRYIDRVIAAVRAWARETVGANIAVTPNDIKHIAEKMIKRVADNAPSTIDGDISVNTNTKKESGQDTANQTDTAAFKEWFGNSKVVDSEGKPLIVYHGTIKAFNEFNTSDFGALLGKGSYFTVSQTEAQQYSGQGTRIVPAYLSIEKPYYVKSAMDTVPGRDEMLSMGYDGVIQKNDDGSVKWAVAHKPNQIKSATDNTGAFDSSNPDIRYSRRYSNADQNTPAATTKQKAVKAARFGQAVVTSTGVHLSLLLRRHLATPLHVAILNPQFKKFHDSVQARIAYENNEAGKIQLHLPEIWDTRVIAGKKKKALDKVSRAIFDGTMADKLWSDAELETQFEMGDNEKDIYKRTREAIDESTRNLTNDTLSALAKGTKLVSLSDVNALKLSNFHPEYHSLMLETMMTNKLEQLDKGGLISAAAVGRMQAQLDTTFDMMQSIAVKYDNLVADGYAPLMRFGHYAVEVRDKVSNELDLFELYETELAQKNAIRGLKKKYDLSQYTIGKGTLNPDGFKQFTNKGLSPETVQLFAAELGLDTDSAHQAYLKVAVSNRSALKRLIHRKKVPGYSEDLPRVISSFVMSNARYSGRLLHNSEIENAIQKIEDGNLQSESQNVFENMENPQEEFAGTRSMMFHWFMGLSPAFMFLNLTQPFTQTIPKLTAYVGAIQAHKEMTRALGIMGKYAGKATWNAGKNVTGNSDPDWHGFEDNLPAWVSKEDYLRMTREGHLDPQNIWNIRGLERGKQGVFNGVWGNIERVAGWPAETSEAINRRATMIAAFKVADIMGDTKMKAKGFNSRYDFAVSVIAQTQGVYNKGNRSGLARGNGKLGQYGPLVMVFKQFSINYVEQMIRHAKDGRKDINEVKALATAMIWQFMLAGALGMPFVDDLRDLIEGIMYRVFGISSNFEDYLETTFGKRGADAFMFGMASEYSKIDFHGRSSMGNLIPLTDIVRPGVTDWGEALGASSGFFENFYTAGKYLSDGRVRDAVTVAAPRYMRDTLSSAEVVTTGSYRNHKGDLVMELDTADAIIKAFQFNPSANAKQGRERGMLFDMKNMINDRQADFVTKLTEATFKEQDDVVESLYAEMDRHNERNAEQYQIDIDKVEASVERKLKNKDFSSSDRSSKTLPDQLEEYVLSK